MSIHGALDFVIMSGISLGLACFFLKLVSEGNTEYEDFFFAYKNIFSAMLLSLLEGIFIFLWTLLFIIPGIVAAYRYKMAFYILAESTNISPLDAIRISKKMTKGRKMELFIFDLSFIGWFLLTAITFGITGIYVYPYYNTARTVMYKEIKKEYIDKKAAERKNEIENENEVNTEL